MTDKKLLAMLIEIGRKEDFAVLKTLFLSEKELEWHSSIMRRGSKFWYDIADSLAEEDIVALMKAFTIAEMTLKGWGAGSVSPVGWLGRKLVERNRVLADKVATWVVSNTDNDYLPFGRCNVKTVDEYIFKDIRRHFELLTLEKKRASEVAERTKKIVEQHKIHIDKQRKRSEQRTRLLKKLDKLTPSERLAFIANDKKHPIDYYPLKYAEVEPEMIKLLKPTIRNKLISRIGVRRKGVWKKLSGILSISVK